MCNHPGTVVKLNKGVRQWQFYPSANPQARTIPRLPHGPHWLPVCGAISPKLTKSNRIIERLDGVLDGDKPAFQVLDAVYSLAMESVNF